jgi:hypothetical protein
MARENYIEEQFGTREERDKRWEALMLVKPHVVRDTTSVMGPVFHELREEPCPDCKQGHIVWRVRYPMLVLPSHSRTRNAVWS